MTQIFKHHTTHRTKKRGAKLSADSKFIEIGYYPFIDNGPDYTPGIEAFSFVDETDEENKTVTRVYAITDISLDTLKTMKISQIKSNTIADANVVINGITYHGGESSASAIYGAINLALMEDENEVGIWDIYDDTTFMSIIAATEIGKTIGKTFREIMYSRQAKISAIKAIEDETYPTLADARAAIDAIAAIEIGETYPTFADVVTALELI